MPDWGPSWRSSVADSSSPADAAMVNRSPSGTRRATPGTSNTLATTRTMVLSRSSTDRSSTSSSDSSKRRRVSVDRRLDSDRADWRLATTRTITSMTIT